MQTIDTVVSRPKLFNGLFECLFSDDEVVGMRAGDELGMIARTYPTGGSAPDWRSSKLTVPAMS